MTPRVRQPIGNRHIMTRCCTAFRCCDGLCFDAWTMFFVCSSSQLLKMFGMIRFVF